MEQPPTPSQSAEQSETAPLTPERQEEMRRAWEELSEKILNRCAQMREILADLPDDNPEVTRQWYTELADEWVDTETGEALGLGAELNKLHDDFQFFKRFPRLRGFTVRMMGELVNGKWNTGKDWMSPEDRNHYKENATHYLEEFIEEVEALKI